MAEYNNGISQHKKSEDFEESYTYEDKEPKYRQLMSPIKSKMASPDYLVLSETFDRSNRESKLTKTPDNRYFKQEAEIKPKTKSPYQSQDYYQLYRKKRETGISHNASYELYSDKENRQYHDWEMKRKQGTRNMPSTDNQYSSRYSTDRYLGYNTDGIALGRSMHVPVKTSIPVKSLHEKQNIIRREKEPQIFDSKTTDWQDYLVHFEQVAEWNEWNDLEKAKMSLRGPAQKLLITLSKQDLGNYNKIRESLSHRFNPKEREAAYSCEFESRRQTRDETVSEYGQALRRLGYLAFPNEKQDSEMLEKVLINKFIRGLNNLDLQKHVQFQRARTLDTAISYAIEYEAFINPQNQFRKPRMNDTESVIPVKAIKDNNKGNSSLQTEASILDKVSKLIDEKLNQFSITEGQNNRPFNRNYQRSPRFYGRGRGRYFKNRNKSDLACFNCGERGHFQYECPQYQQGNEQQLG